MYLLDSTNNSSSFVERRNFSRAECVAFLISSYVRFGCAPDNPPYTSALLLSVQLLDT